MEKELLFQYVERLCRAKPGSAPMEKALYDIFVKEFIEKGYAENVIEKENYEFFYIIWFFVISCYIFSSICFN